MSAAGGCSEPNDGVDDTAQEAQPQFGCPATAPSSCPHKPAGQPRLDPIHSYMDYSPDACMTQFTAGQQLRMQAAWTQYRASQQQQQVVRRCEPSRVGLAQLLAPRWLCLRAVTLSVNSCSAMRAPPFLSFAPLHSVRLSLTAGLILCRRIYRSRALAAANQNQRLM